jgi:hypothetical protein
MQERPLTLKQPGHEQTNWFGDGQNEAEEHDNLQNANTRHRTPQNFSGLNIAHPRYTSKNTETMPDTM